MMTMILTVGARLRPLLPSKPLLPANGGASYGSKRRPPQKGAEALKVAFLSVVFSLGYVKKAIQFLRIQSGHRFPYGYLSDEKKTKTLLFDRSNAQKRRNNLNLMPQPYFIA